MKKTITALLLSVGLLLCCLCGAQASSLTKAERYEALQQELHRYFDGDDCMALEELTAGFEELGSYKKSAAFSYYTAILLDVEAGNYTDFPLHVELLRMDKSFHVLLEDNFPSIDELEAYALGRQAEANGAWPTAIDYYQQSIDMLDSIMRIANLRTATPVLIAQEAAVGDYIIDIYSDGTCTITSYSGNASILEIPMRLDDYQVTAIGNRAFYDCSFLQSVSLPAQVSSIGPYAFAYCWALSDVYLPNNLTSIGSYAFSYCSSLTSVTIPQDVISVGENPFAYCPLLSDICITTTHPVLSTIDCLLIDHVEKRLICAYSANTAEDLTIPKGTQIIGNDAFLSFTALTSLTIPDSVIIIGDNAFSLCPQLILRVKQDSFAHQYAIDNDLRYITY